MHDDLSSPGLISLADSIDCFSIATVAETVDQPPGREVGTGENRQQIIHRDPIAPRPVLGDIHHGITDLPQVVRRDLGGHADGNPVRPIDQEIGKHGGQHHRFLEAAVEIVRPGYCVHVEVLEHHLRQLSQACLRVPHGGRGISVDRSEVALPIDQGGLHDPILGHADHRQVD